MTRHYWPKGEKSDRELLAEALAPKLRQRLKPRRVVERKPWADLRPSTKARYTAIAQTILSDIEDAGYRLEAI